MKIHWKQGLSLLIITLPVAIIDQITKFWAIGLKGTKGVEVFASWFHLIYAENRGAIWGLGNDFPEFYRKLVFLGLSTVITVIFFFLILVKKENRLMNTVYALVLGGAIGNLFDRYYHGFVVDFIDWHVGDLYHWPTFNIADAAIVVAVGLLIIEMIRTWKKEKET